MTMPNWPQYRIQTHVYRDRPDIARNPRRLTPGRTGRVEARRSSVSVNIDNSDVALSILVDRDVPDLLDVVRAARLLALATNAQAQRAAFDALKAALMDGHFV
jgi:hypothetical protein